jgi:cellulose synthase/poly-beta-1,6-N-acetylglucosamine synthase-like glycosyltransferase
MARLSIIIPSKNEQRYIGVTLAQFEPWLEQFDLEIIVSDANSADGTAETVREYIGRWGHARLKLVQSAGKQTSPSGATSAQRQPRATSCFTPTPMCASRSRSVFLAKCWPILMILKS